jgi:hypothetical protein
MDALNRILSRPGLPHNYKRIINLFLAREMEKTNQFKNLYPQIKARIQKKLKGIRQSHKSIIR